MKTGLNEANKADQIRIKNEDYGLLPHHENWRVTDYFVKKIANAAGFEPDIDLFSCVSGANKVLYADFFLSSRNDAYGFNWGLLRRRGEVTPMNLWCNSTWTFMGRTLRKMDWTLVNYPKTKATVLFPEKPTK